MSKIKNCARREGLGVGRAADEIDRPNRLGFEV